jgi:molecular chaperone HtpG
MNKPLSFYAPSDIVVGKDILELVSSAMYVDPLTVYREYIQNAADSIDDAKDRDILGPRTHGRVDITLDAVARRAVVRDNGAGVPNSRFVRKLTALGASHKRGTPARGFRGIGRLAGLGYCQELVFRSRSQGDPCVYEARWDGRAFKRLLQDHSYQGDVRDLIQEVATITKLPGGDWPDHFFEVEMVKPIRVKNDLLLNPEAIAAYLGQTVCVPFSPEFKFGKKITDFIKQHLKLGEIRIHIDGNEEPVYRPYRDAYRYDDDKFDAFTEPEFRTIEDLDGNVGAVMWLLHHGYHGAIPASEGVGGLRARKGNIQVGDPRIFADAFPEPRFASWTVGEVHVIDSRVLPNGRRDEFEQTANYGHLTTQLTAVGDAVARRCRQSSVARNRLKSFEIGATKIQEQFSILEQGAVAKSAANAIIQGIRSEMHEIKRIAEDGKLREDDRAALDSRYGALEKRLHKVEVSNEDALAAIPNMSGKEQRTVKKMIALIYECSVNRVAAKVLVDRILARLGSESTGAA